MKAQESSKKLKRVEKQKPNWRSGSLIHIISRIGIHINCNGVPVLRAYPRKSNPKELNPHFQQGSLDGACGVYAVTMMLTLHGCNVEQKDLGNALTQLLVGHVLAEVKKSENTNVKSIVCSAPVGVLCTGGTNADLWKNLVENIAPRWKLVSVPLAGKEPASRLTTDGLVGLAQRLRSGGTGKPILAGLTYDGGGHATVVVGYETEGEAEVPKRLFLLDPASGQPTVCPWNSVLERVESNGKVVFRWADIERRRWHKHVEIDELYVLEQRKQET